MDGAHRFPCSACGADVLFDPGTGGLRCPHCGHEDPIGAPSGPWGGPSGAIREQDYAAALEGGLTEDAYEETRVLGCTSCGAQVELDGTTQGTVCPFCASPLVGTAGINRHIKPRAVLPFALDERTARAAMTDWLGRLWFAPNGLTRYARKGRAMDGVYVPYWTFDARTRSRYAGHRGTVYHVSRSVVRNGQRHTEQVPQIRWRAVTGAVARDFDDVLVLGSRALPRDFTQGLPPWDLTQLRPYAPEYLAGLRTEAYGIPLDEAFGDARTQMDRQIERDVRFDIGGDRQRVDRISTEVGEVTFKHVLLPIWIAAYRYGGRSYRIVINGQTGRVQGERPWSIWKIALAVLAGALLAAGFGFLAANG